MDGAPCSPPQLPNLENGYVRKGEFRRQIDGANEGHVETYLNFAAVPNTDPKWRATLTAIKGLNTIIHDEVIEKYGLYSAGVAYGGWAVKKPSINLILKTGDKEGASDHLSYALELMQSPETLRKISAMHSTLIERQITEIETEQPKVEVLATNLNYLAASGGPLESQKQIIKNSIAVTREQVIEVIHDLSTAPAFLNVRGHNNALNSVPSIDVIDGWRAKPSRPANKSTEQTPPHPKA